MRKAIVSKALVGAVFVVAVCGATPTAADSRQEALQHTARNVEIVIKSRQFRPSRVSLPLGGETRLVFVNKDVELHAFVPLTFLEHVPLHVSGNGAPQFGDSGLVRVLIPSGGRAEIQFVPRARGVYHYQCDLPGHQMVGEIVVEDSLGGPGAAQGSDDSSEGQR